MRNYEFDRRQFLQFVAAAGATALAGRRALSADQLTTTAILDAAMQRAAKCCLAWLNPREHMLPTGGYEPAHDTGRWWDAMLRFEHATAIRIPADVENAMMDNVRKLTDNPAALLTSHICNPHNLRESMLAYAALVRYRQSDWARRQGLLLVTTIGKLLRNDGQLDFAQMAALVGKPLNDDPLMIHSSPTGQWFNATANTGRCIEALLWFHEVTGEMAALDLAKRLSEVHLQQTIDPSGVVRREFLDPNHVGHNHSYLGTLRGLLAFGIASGDRKYVDAVANTYERGLWGTTVSHSGWTPHDQGKTRFPDGAGDPVGEHASCGDVAQIALWLALRAGQTQRLDDVERLVRARLLPSQIIDANDARRDGAWGAYADGFGRGSILDVIAAVLHTLTDIREQSVASQPDGTITVNLHFDRDTPDVRVHSRRETTAALHVAPRQTAALRVRVPAWSARSSVRVTAADQAVPFIWDGPFVVVAKDQVAAGKVYTIHHDLPLTETSETLPVSHRTFRLRWRGEDVLGCQPGVDIYPQ